VWKLIVFVVAFCAGTAILSTFDAVAHPTIAASLAVDQLQDTESSAIAMRAYDRAQNFLPGGIQGAILFLGAYLLFGTALFRADLARLATQTWETIKS
jgi:hypothetical protein